MGGGAAGRPPHIHLLSGRRGVASVCARFDCEDTLTAPSAAHAPVPPGVAVTAGAASAGDRSRNRGPSRGGGGGDDPEDSGAD